MTERVLTDNNGRKYITTEPKLDQGTDYERGFVDGMQKQMQSSVDKAVNRMAQRTWQDERIKLPAQEWLGYDPERGDLHGYTFEQMREFTELIVQECINCYSPDDSATDWADKMRRMIEP
jgi:hypothetical protein